MRVRRFAFGSLFVGFIVFLGVPLKREAKDSSSDWFQGAVSSVRDGIGRLVTKGPGNMELIWEVTTEDVDMGRLAVPGAPSRTSLRSANGKSCLIDNFETSGVGDASLAETPIVLPSVDHLACLAR